MLSCWPVPCFTCFTADIGIPLATTLKKTRESGVSEYLHEELTVHVAAPPELVFAHLDDPVRIGGHMTKPSAMMLGGSMSYEVDEFAGRQVGSVIRMSGAILDLRLAIEEVVTEHSPPWRKSWQTRGPQRLIVIEAYRMGFQLASEERGTRATFFIDYLPTRARIIQPLVSVIARAYARWCLRRIASKVS
jgi:hypothetical protein